MIGSYGLLSCPAALAVLLLVTATTLGRAAAPLEDLRTLWKEWSRLKGTISEERSSWEREKQSIADALLVSRQEVDLLTNRLAQLSNSSTGTEKQRADILDRIADAKTSMTVFSSVIERYEAGVRELVPILPAHMKTEIAPVLQRLPAEGKPTAMPVSQRMQTVIAFLAQLDKFNSAPSLVSEVREVDKGRSLEVRTLYFGLGIAYYSDAAGSFAGHGHPTASGWTWTPVDAATAVRIGEAIAIYQNQKQPAFVSLPARID